MIDKNNLSNCIEWLEYPPEEKLSLMEDPIYHTIRAVEESDRQKILEAYNIPAINSRVFLKNPGSINPGQIYYVHSVNNSTVTIRHYPNYRIGWILENFTLQKFQELFSKKRI